MPRRHSKPIEIRMPTVRYADFYIKLQVIDGVDLTTSIITPEGYLYNTLYPGGYVVRPITSELAIPLNPCPFCNSDPVAILVEYGLKYSRQAQRERYSPASTVTTAYAMMCSNDRECGLRAPIRQDLTVAAKAWNKLSR